MKKTLSLLMIMSIIITTVIIAPTVKAVDKWDGSILEPQKLTSIDGTYYYEIEKPEELAFIAQASGKWLNYNYILKNDIVLNSEELLYDETGSLSIDISNLKPWIPIDHFSGIFNGNNHTISGVYIDQNRSAGLFNNLDGDLYNLHVENSYIKGSSNVGGVCATHTSTGKNISGCTYSGAVIGTSSVGGIIGSNHTTYISNCINYGDVWASEGDAAGIVGSYYAYSIDNCSNYGSITSNGSNVAGITPSTTTYGISYCFNYGDIKGQNFVSGICSSMYHGGAFNCGNTGTIDGCNYVGGISSYCTYHYVESWMSSVSGSYNTGTIIGEDKVGGLIGYLSYANVSSCFNAGSVNASGQVGGLIGYSDSIWNKGSVNNSYYLKSESINSNLRRFGNDPISENDEAEKSEGFFCLNTDNTLNLSGHSIQNWIELNESEHCGYCSNNAEHTIKEPHVFNITIDIQKPDCTKNYSTTYTCTKCGYTYSETHTASEHAYSEWQVEPPIPCVAGGSEYRTCSKCGRVERRNEQPIEHFYGDWIVSKESTCSRTGSRYRICESCKARETEIIEMLPHQFGDWIITKDPTCWNSGSHYRVCEGCNKRETESMDALGHNYGEWVEVEPTCTNQGYCYQICSRCGNQNREWTSDFLPHQPGDWIIGREPTCTNQGYRYQICQICGNTIIYEDLSPTGHTFTDWNKFVMETDATVGVEIRFCSVCGYYELCQTDPINPTTPTDPTDPTDPTNPTNPTEPTEPTTGPSTENEQNEEPQGFFAKIAAFFRNLLDRIFGIFKR